MAEKHQFISGTLEKIDKRLLSNRMTEEGNVVSCLLQNLTYYDDCCLESKSFLTTSGRMLFSIGKQIRDKGFSTFDEITMISNLKEDVLAKVNEEMGGFNAIQRLMDVVPINNWDAFLDSLNKSNIIISLYQKGFNVLEEITLDNGKKIVPYQAFEKLTSSEVLSFYESTLSSLGTSINSSKIIGQEFIDFDEDFIDRLADHEELGVDFGTAGLNVHDEEIRTFPFMSANLMGLKRGTLSCWAASSGSGKSSYMVGLTVSLISKGLSVCFVTNESAIADVKIQFLVWVLTRCLDYWECPKSKIIVGNFTEKDRAKIREARQYWKEHYAKSVKIIALSDADANLTNRIIKSHIAKYAMDVFIVDTFKLSFSGDKNDSFWLALIEDVRQLTETAMRTNTIGIITMQLAINSQNRSFLTADCLSNSKAVKETLSNLVLFRKCINSLELDPNSPYYIRPFRSKQDKDGNWIEEPYLPDPTKTWRIAFVDKARRGVDSETGVAYLWRFDGNSCNFYETAKCRPTHKIFNTEGR